MRFRLNIDIRKEMEDSRLNAIKPVVTHLFGTSNFICSRTHPPPVFFRTRAVVAVVYSIVFSANPVKP